MNSGVGPAPTPESGLGQVVVICVFLEISLVGIPKSETHNKSEGQGVKPTLYGYFPERIYRLATEINEELGTDSK